MLSEIFAPKIVYDFVALLILTVWIWIFQFRFRFCY